MIRVSLFLLVFLTLVTMSCNGQPKSTYVIANRDASGNIVPVVGASSYSYFLEKEVMNDDYMLTDGMDYLSPNVTQYQIGTSTLPSFEVILPNDGSNYAVGMVAVNAAGFYGAMGVGIDNVSIVPTKPGGVDLRRK